MITLNATHQQTKRVVDPVMGTYQTVLTIDPSVGQSGILGIYSCTVENARGESSMTAHLMNTLVTQTCKLLLYKIIHSS